MNKFGVFAAFIVAIFIIGAGCSQKPIGGDKDEHGCLIAAGYSWCDAKQKCLRIWEEGCPGNENYCQADADCIPKPECHPTSCINKEFEANYEKPQVCTDIYMVNAAYNKEDCVCVNNACINKKANCGDCPLLAPPAPGWCNDGEIVSGGVNNCGCQLPPTCVQKDEMTEELCDASKGNWNECSNKCELENQGNEDVVCTSQCEALCECGGLVGFRCPEGYSCILPSGVSDAFGYCAKGAALTMKEAKAIADSSECTSIGTIDAIGSYNSNSRTWWFDLKANEPKQGCNPACVVFEETHTVEINWRCTGLIQDE